MTYDPPGEIRGLGHAGLPTPLDTPGVDRRRLTRIDDGEGEVGKPVTVGYERARVAVEEDVLRLYVPRNRKPCGPADRDRLAGQRLPVEPLGNAPEFRGAQE